MKRAARVVLVLTLSMAGAGNSFTRALAKNTKKPLKPALVMQEPIFDTSLVPRSSKFEASIKHTQIIYPDDPKKLMQGENKLLDLRGENSGTLLKGQLTDNNLDSIIRTKEHDIKAKFYVDFARLTAKYAPDIARYMEARIAQARRKAAQDALKAEIAMDKELKNRKALNTIPPQMATKSAPEQKLPFDLAAAKKQASADAQKALQKLKAAAAQKAAKEQVSGNAIPQALPVKVEMPQLKQIHVKMPLPAKPTPETAAAEKLMESKLLKAKLMPAASMEAQLNTAAKLAEEKAKASLAQAAPAMNSLLTHVRLLSAPTAAQKEEKQGPESKQSQILWDAWHRNFAALAQKPILAQVLKAGNPKGDDTIEITVYRDHRLEARVYKASKPDYDQALLQAYRSLSGNPGLEFPPGSRRISVSFLVDNKYDCDGTPASVKSQATVGDRELVKSRR